MYKIFFLIIIFSITLKSQQIDKSTYYEYGNKFYSSFIIEPVPKSDSSKITFLYKISYASLNFSKTSKGPRSQFFTAYPSIEATFKDGSGIIRHRTFLSDTINIDNYDKSKNKYEYMYGFTQFDLKNDEYDIKIKLLNKYSKKTDEKKISKRFGFNSKGITPVFFTAKNTENSYSPYILGGNILFNSEVSRCYFYSKDVSEDFSFRCKKVKNNNSEFKWNKEIDLTGNIDQKRNSSFSIQHDDFSKIPEIKFGNSSEGKNLFSFELPSHSFVPGKYELTLRNDATGDTSISYFKVKWEEMPLSLKNIDFAVKSMFYIMTEEEHDKLDEGSDTEKFKKIIKYWQDKDPTPNTPYNEAMAEYFKRVDYAAFNFRTLKERDGSQTDRGKIFILYGEPSDKEKILEDDKTIEKWKYSNVNKTFIFEMISSGVYKLTKIEEDDS